MTEVQKSWKLKLDFKNGVPNLAASVNRMYYNFDLMLEVISFYESSDLLQSDLALIEVYENNVYKSSSYFYTKSIDNSNRFSF